MSVCSMAKWPLEERLNGLQQMLIKAYNNIYINTSSDYYVGDKDSSVINTYNSFAQLIADDKKDICNKFEKLCL